MPRLSRATMELWVKIVYVGPGDSGKTTNLVQLHEISPASERGELLVSNPTGDRTVYFDYFSSELGMVGPYRLRAELFAAPGQRRYAQTRSLMLTDADGVVFVADSDPDRSVDNLRSIEELRRFFDADPRGSAPALVFQLNKRDLVNAAPIPFMVRHFGIRDEPVVEASALNGAGVVETRDTVLERVFGALRARRPRPGDSE